MDAKARAQRAAATRLGVPLDAYLAALDAGQKFCGGCRLPRAFDQFSTDGKRLRSRCRLCDGAQRKTHYHSNRADQRAKQLAYQRANRERLYAYNAEWSRKRHKELRAEAIEAYGSACSCCGERQSIFLDLDHVANDGAAHRKEVGNTTRMMVALKADGWPRGRFQLLCCNCNQGKARNGGVCPHANGAS